MKMLLISGLMIASSVMGQSYTSYLTGDSSDVVTNPAPGLVLMGGGGENDQAMTWFLNRADGGDVLVIRASGADGYNDYLFSELGVSVNSVETIVFNEASAAEDPYVLSRITQAEALWIAGGDQWDYISYWKDNAVEDAINYLIEEKKITVGGISAGMAIMGDAYFSAQTGTVTSDEALNNPYDEQVQLGWNDFIRNPAMTGTITDTHFDSPDRKGRLITFMARLFTDYGFLPVGIACEEYTAVCIDTAGIATVYGEYPDYEDLVYFLQVNCQEPNSPQQCIPGQPLQWQLDELTVHATVLAGTPSGTSSIDLYDMENITGPVFAFQNWQVNSGTLEVLPFEEAYTCDSLISYVYEVILPVSLYPNPASEAIVFQAAPGIYRIFRADGQEVEQFYSDGSEVLLQISLYPAGYYVISGQGFACPFMKFD